MATSICCSIELEPKTLNQGQLNLAREVAAGVVEKMEPSDASTIFTEGLREVLTGGEMLKMNEAAANKFEENIEFHEKGIQMTEIPCQCACNNVIITESPDQVNLIKEPLSAPF